MEPKPIPYHDLIRARQPAPRRSATRPICQLVTESVARYLDDRILLRGQAGHVGGDPRRVRVCNEHASQLAQLTGKGLGVALIHEDIIDTVTEGLAQAAPGLRGGGEAPLRAAVTRITPGGSRSPTRTDQSGHVLAPQGPCLACRHQLLVEESYLGTLWRYLDDEALAVALRASPGLCLPHLRQALPGAPSLDVLRRLIEIQSDCLGRLRAELRELTRKFDHRFKHEVIGAEGDAWLRSIAIVSGKRGIR